MIDAKSVKSILEDELRKPSLASWIGGTVRVGIMRKIRDWHEDHRRFSPVKLEPEIFIGLGFEVAYFPRIFLFLVAYLTFKF